MRHTTPAIFVIAIALLGAECAHAQGGVAPWHATLANEGAYDITYEEDVPLYTYLWEVTFHGIGTGAANERIRAFALYYLPDEAMPLTDQVAASTITNPVEARDGRTTVEWSWPGEPRPQKGNTVSWSADNPTSAPAASDAVFVGETIGLFLTTFAHPLPEEYLSGQHIYSGVHVMWTDSDGNDQSEWVNQTPEPVSAVLLALGIPAALIARRRKAAS